MTELLNYIFTSIYAAEAIIKLIAFGPKTYFEDSWNIFDFTIIAGSIISIFALMNGSMSNLKGGLTVIRSFRILRIARLIKRAKSLNLIFQTFLVSLPGMANIGALLLLMIYIYSVIGVQLLGEIKRNGIITDTLNFESFTQAFCVLCALATGDTWGIIVNSLQSTRSITFQCIENPSYQDFLNAGGQPVGCGAGIPGLIYCLSFFLFVNLIFLNLFIAIVLQGFADTMEKEQRLFNQDILRHFSEIWAEFDPEATSFIPLASLRPFLKRLG